MARRKYKHSIPGLIQGSNRSESLAYKNLTAKLKRATGTYNQAHIIHAEILHRVSVNVETISAVKSTQWKVVNYCVLLCAAVVGSTRLIVFVLSTTPLRALGTLVVALLLALITYAAYGMLRKTEKDLDFYRSHSQVNSEMMAATTQVEGLANELVSARRSDLAPKHGYTKSARDNQRVFTLWLYRIMIGAAIASMGVAALLIWTVAPSTPTAATP